MNNKVIQIQDKNRNNKYGENGKPGNLPQKRESRIREKTF
jgi:hypothetical protein